MRADIPLEVAALLEELDRRIEESKPFESNFKRKLLSVALSSNPFIKRAVPIHPRHRAAKPERTAQLENSSMAWCHLHDLRRPAWTVVLFLVVAQIQTLRRASPISDRDHACSVQPVGSCPRRLSRRPRCGVCCDRQPWPLHRSPHRMHARPRTPSIPRVQRRSYRCSRLRSYRSRSRCLR